MADNHADYNRTFIDLMGEKKPEGKIYRQKSFENWYVLWKKRQDLEGELSGHYRILKKNINPMIIPRNHKVEQALSAANDGDFKDFYALLEAIRFPYDQHEHLQSYQIPPTPTERVYQTFCGT
jgi:uncharacterized protein YdiU (UPF0061 family)